jgi:hypothetical protein
MDASGGFTFILTASELKYLLPEHAAAWRCLRIGERDDEEQRLAVEGALFARGLLGAAETPVISPMLHPILQALTTPDAWVEVGIATGDEAGGFQLFDHASDCIEIEARPFDSFSLTRIELTGSATDVVVDFTERFITKEAPRAVFVRTSPDDDGSEFAVAHSSVDRYSVAVGDVRSAPGEQIEPQAIGRALRDYLSASEAPHSQGS